MAAIGVVLTGAVVLAALVGNARVKAAHRANMELVRVWGYQQDADRMHDALRADVLNAVATGSGDGIDGPGEIREAVAAHAAQLRVDLAVMDDLSPAGSEAAVVGSTVPALAQYADQAESLVEAALTDPAAARVGLVSFDDAFHRLEVSQADVTRELAAASRRGLERELGEEGAAQRQLLTVSVMAVLGVFGLAFALNRLGRRVVSSTEQLRARDRHFVALIDNSADMITVADADGLICYDSPSVERVLGYHPAERLGTAALEYVHPDHLVVAGARFAGEGPLSDTSSTAQIRVRHRDGSWRWVEGVWSNLLDVPEVAGIVVNWREIGERKAFEERLFAEREFLGAVLESLEDGVVACDSAGVLTLFNGATRRFHGLPEKDLPPEEWAEHYNLFLPDQTTPMGVEDIPLFQALSGEVVRNVEMVIAPKNDKRRLIQASGRAIYGADGAKLGAVVTMHDTTEHREVQQELSRQAHTDPLTGLGNRASLSGHLDGALARAASTGTPLSLLVVDLDDFKKVNDSSGHAAADGLLVEMATRLRACLDDSGVAVRLGADEFAVVLEDADEQQTILVADRILAAARAPFFVDDSEITVTASIGIALGSGAWAGDRLLRAADLAMHVAKSRDKDGHALFEPHMHLAALSRLAMEADLRRAHAQGDLTLAYQPVVSLTTGAMVGVEALLRWHPPGKSPIGPDDFIPVAEESGLIVPIGAWVLEEACAQARRWDQASPDRPPLTVAVNISARQLQRAGLINILVEVLQRTGLEPGRLVLELTESTLMADDEVALTTLREIEQLGVKLSIDDFGIGYSSLSRLDALPVAAVKIDRSFVEAIGGPDTEAPLVVATLAMAKGLGLSVVAEGIETTGQLEFLLRHGCPQAQGFLMSRPVEPAAIGLILQQNPPLIDIARHSVSHQTSTATA